MEIAIPQIIRNITISQELPIDYFSYVVSSGVHGTVTTACSPFFDAARKAALERNEQLPAHDVILRHTYISAVVLADPRGELFHLPVRMPFSKSRRQYKASLLLAGEYMSGNRLYNFDREIDLTVFYNVSDHVGGFVSITGIFSSEDGICGIMNALEPFRVEQIVISADLSLVMN